MSVQRLSKGLGAPEPGRFMTCRYFMVAETSAWPRRFWTARGRSVPPSGLQSRSPHRRGCGRGVVRDMKGMLRFCHEQWDGWEEFTARRNGMVELGSGIVRGAPSALSPARLLGASRCVLTSCGNFCGYCLVACGHCLDVRRRCLSVRGDCLDVSGR